MSDERDAGRTFVEHRFRAFAGDPDLTLEWSPGVAARGYLLNVKRDGVELGEPLAFSDRELLYPQEHAPAINDRVFQWVQVNVR